MDLFKNHKNKKAQKKQDTQATQSSLNEAEQELQNDPLQEAVKKNQHKQ